MHLGYGHGRLLAWDRRATQQQPFASLSAWRLQELAHRSIADVSQIRDLLSGMQNKQSIPYTLPHSIHTPNPTTTVRTAGPPPQLQQPAQRWASLQLPAQPS